MMNPISPKMARDWRFIAAFVVLVAFSSKFDGKSRLIAAFVVLVALVVVVALVALVAWAIGRVM